MRLVELRAKEIKTVNTKYGEKLLIVASGDLKSEIKIWRPLSDAVSASIKPNQFFQAAASSDGKYSPIASVETVSPEPSRLRSSSLDKPYTPSPYSPLAELEAAEAPKVHPHITKMAQVMAQCVSAIRAELPGLDAESEQKYATSLFIQAAKEIF